jgi:Sec-independent protein translocase protein TatA
VKKILSIVIAGFVLVLFLGCDRMETAVDTYTKVKKDAKQKAEQAQDEANKIVNKKLKKTGDDTQEEDEKDKDE